MMTATFLSVSKGFHKGLNLNLQSFPGITFAITFTLEVETEALRTAKTFLSHA